MTVIHVLLPLSYNIVLTYNNDNDDNNTNNNTNSTDDGRLDAQFYFYFLSLLTVILKFNFRLFEKLKHFKLHVSKSIHLLTDYYMCTRSFMPASRRPRVLFIIS